MSPTINTNVCSDFTAAPDDAVNFLDYGAGCTLSQDGTNTWPFTIASPFNLPCPTIIKIKSNLPAGPYTFNATCCDTDALKTVTVTT